MGLKRKVQKINIFTYLLSAPLGIQTTFICFILKQKVNLILDIFLPRIYYAFDVKCLEGFNIYF